MDFTKSCGHIYIWLAFGFVKIIVSENRKENMFGLRTMGNTHIPHCKNTAKTPSVTMPDAKEVLLPLSQHIGAPATQLVKVGDSVTVGQKIAEANGYVSSPIYASVSGKVTKIEDYLRKGV